MSANEYYNGAVPPPPGVAAAPSDQNTPAPNKTIFHHQASRHQSHHYLRMYGGQVAQAAMWGFGATLGADVANAAFGEAKVGGWVHVGRRTGRSRRRRRKRTYKVHVSDFWICGLEGFLLSLDDIVGMVAALSFGLWMLDVDDDGCWDEVWRGMRCVLKEVWIQ